MRSFRISTDRVGPRRWCWVRIHDTLDHMHRAAHRRSPWEPMEWWDGCMACFQPTPWKLTEDDGKRWPASGYAGVLRLVDGEVTPEVVAHELVHAAATVYRMNVKPTVRLGDGHVGFHREEEFAYIYGELYASFESQWREGTR
jgi:hypothetical protein